MSVMPPITLGDVSVRPVVEIPRSSFATTSMLPDSTADAVARHHRWLRPHFWDEGTNDLGSRIQSFVVKTPRTTVLIDTCVGNDKNREGSALWHMRRGAFLDDLAGAGVTPDDVDVVVCTHLHVDHVGVRLRTKAGEAVFSGDLMHRVVQVAEPQWSSRFCYDGQHAARTRRAFIERHADTGILVLAAHFPRPGYIVRENGSHRFRPA